MSTLNTTLRLYLLEMLEQRRGRREKGEEGGRGAAPHAASGTGPSRMRSELCCFLSWLADSLVFRMERVRDVVDFSKMGKNISVFFFDKSFAYRK